jgi:hypothetical protein
MSLRLGSQNWALSLTPLSYWPSIHMRKAIYLPEFGHVFISFGRGSMCTWPCIHVHFAECPQAFGNVSMCTWLFTQAYLTVYPCAFGRAATCTWCEFTCSWLCIHVHISCVRVNIYPWIINHPSWPALSHLVKKLVSKNIPPGVPLSLLYDGRPSY